MNLKQFVESAEILKSEPTYNEQFILILTLISALMLAVGIIVWFVMKRISKKIPPYQEIRNRISGLLITTGSIGLLLAFFSWQSIPYLSSRVLLLILFIIFAIWLLFILIYIQRNFSRELKKYEQAERYKKYLPRPKKRRK